ncbi:MAG: endolytic transglycosylase MltG [Eubacteriales bacterium]|nr:endolytic transglycosylase MltG [Eubacteriales bacterium]
MRIQSTDDEVRKQDLSRRRVRRETEGEKKPEARRPRYEEDAPIGEEREKKEVSPRKAFGIRTVRGLLTTVLSVLLVAAVLAVGITFVYRRFVPPVDASDHTEHEFLIVRGSSLISIANQLEREGYIRSGIVFRLYMDFMNLANRLQPGRFVLERSMTIEQIAERLVAGGETVDVKMLRITEGMTIEQIAELFYDNKIVLDKEEFLEACRVGTDFKGYDEIGAIIDSTGRKYMLEGYLFPDTYEFYVAGSVKTSVRKLLAQFQEIYTGDMKARAEELGMTTDEVVTLASLIEKEAGSAEDFARVSAVFHNRLKAGMKLESDATLNYIIGGNRLVFGADDTEIDSPYNTYKYEGLPAGPICSVGARAIRAALYPDETMMEEGKEYYYFTLTDPATRELYYSRTIEEHRKIVDQYRPLWEEYEKEHGN